MQETSDGGDTPETGSIQEQEAIRNLALNVQEVVSIYKKEREEGRDGTNIPLMFIAGDINQLKELGVLGKYKEPLTKFGADPIIRFAVLSQLNHANQSYEQVTDKFHILENIRMHLELGEALGLNESAGNPDFEDAARLFNSFKEKYSTPAEPEEPIESAEPAQTPRRGIMDTVGGLLERMRERRRQDRQFKQIAKELQSVDLDDETVQHYVKLCLNMNDSSLANRLEDLVPVFKNGFSPDSLKELTSFSEEVATKLENSERLDPEQHKDNIKNVRRAVWAAIKEGLPA